MRLRAGARLAGQAPDNRGEGKLRRRRLLVLGVAAAALAALAGIQIGRTVASAASAGPCQLGTSATGSIQHVIYLQFDNTHYSRDATNVASELEQMPHLLNFL